MKKILILLIAIFCIQNVSIAKMTDDVFVVKNAEPSLYAKQLSLKLLNPQIDDNAIYAKSGEFYYFKTYQDGENLNIFFVSDKENQEKNINLIRGIGYKSYKIEDKDLKKKYEKDFNSFVSSANIPVKYIGKKSKKHKYNPYSKPLNNLKLEEISMENENIKIIRSKYKSKSEVQDFANGYEYLIINNNPTPITLKYVGSSDFLTLQEIAKRCLIITYSDYIPIFSLVRAIRTDIEKNKFTRIMPTNQTINPHQSIKVLALAYLQVNPKADFDFEINSKEYKFTFER